MNRSLTDSILIGGACLFACWTAFCYVAVFSQSGFSALITWWFIPLAAGLILTYLCLEKRPTIDGEFSGSPARRNRRCGPINHTCMLLALGLATVVLRQVDAPYFWVWTALLCTTMLVIRIAFTSSGEHPLRPVSDSRWKQFGLLALVACGAILVAITHRPDLDDSQYLNFVVTALDFPSEALYSHSGLWQDRNVPLESPVYRFHTYELLIATLSHIFGVNHKTIYYMILPPLFGGIAVLVHWRLAQYFLPRYALSFLLAWFIFLIALGESHREIGNFAFVRLYQGKSLLVTVALPLCLLLGLQYSASPNWRSGLALSMAALASLGLSSSALVTVPIVLAAALAGGLPGASRAVLKRIIIGGLISTLALIAVGLFLVMSIGIGGATFEDTLPSASNGLAIVLGEGMLGGIVLALFPIAPLFVSGCRKKRIYATTTLFYIVAVFNPWVLPFIAQTLDLALQWRLLWSVPFVISASLALVGLAALLAKKMSQPQYPVIVVVMLVGLLLISKQWSFSPDNLVTVALPAYKVESIEHALASKIVHNAPQQSIIYAPLPVAAWIPTFRAHPYPLIARNEYVAFGRTRQYFGMPEIRRRWRVINILEGRSDDVSSIAFFDAQLEIDKPSFVVYESSIAMASALSDVLGEAGYIGEKYGSYWAWQRQH